MNVNILQPISTTQDGQVNLVTFRLDRQTYALPIEPIQQIIEMVTITPVPQVKDSIEGVINFHGAAVPVINLRSHLGLPKEPLRLHTPIILVTVSGRLIGLLVDDVLNVLNWPTDQIVHPKDILPEGLGDVPLLRGLVQTGDAVIMLLDLEHLFSSQSSRILAEVANVLHGSSEQNTTLKIEPQVDEPSQEVEE